jgi:hypothetical protein
MPFWMSFMYANGARAAGQRELRFFALESGVPHFPDDYQDTAAGCSAMASVESESRAAHERRPKSKRVNFALYRIESPFSVNLPSLAAKAADQAPNSSRRQSSDAERQLAESDSVGRKSLVRILRTEGAIRRAIGAEPPRAEERVPLSSGVRTRQVAKRPRRESETHDPHTIPSIGSLRAGGLNDDGGGGNDGSGDGVGAVCPTEFVRVSVRPCSKGTPMQNAIICVPTDEDFARMRASPSSYAGPRERLARKADLRVGAKPTRQVVGRITYGDYSLVRGRGLGSGVMTAHAFRELLARQSGRAVSRPSRRGAHTGSKSGRESSLHVRVLYRNVRSLQYRFAVATIRFE